MFANAGKPSAAASLFAAVEKVKKQQFNADPQEPEIEQSAFFENLQPNAMLEAIEQVRDLGYRADGMAVMLEWAKDGDPSFDSLDAMAQGMAMVDEDLEEVEEEEEDAYNSVMMEAAGALASIGIDPELVMKAVDGDKDAGESVFFEAASTLDKSEITVAERIAEYSVAEQLMTEAMERVVRNGKVVYVKRPLRKKRLTAKQRAALKRARAKSQTASAKAARAKAMRIRESRNM